MAKSTIYFLLDFSKIARSQNKSKRAKIVLFEGKVALAVVKI